MLRFYGPTDSVSFFESTLVDAMRSTDVSELCVTGSRTGMFPFRFTCFLDVPLWIVDSSMLTILYYAYPLRFVDSSAESLFPDI